MRYDAECYLALKVDPVGPVIQVSDTALILVRNGVTIGADRDPCQSTESQIGSKASGSWHGGHRVAPFHTPTNVSVEDSPGGCNKLS